MAEEEYEHIKKYNVIAELETKLTTIEKIAELLSRMKFYREPACDDENQKIKEDILELCNQRNAQCSK